MAHRESRKSRPERKRQSKARLKAGDRSAHLLAKLLVAGIPVLLALTTVLYAPCFNDYMIPKAAAVHCTVALLVALWLMRGVLSERLHIVRSPLYLPLAAYLTVSLVALAAAHNLAKGAESLLLQMWFFALCLLVLNTFQQAAAAKRVLWTVALLSLAVSSLGILQYFGVHLIPVPQASGDLAISTLGNPNFVAHYLDIAILVTAGLLVAERRGWQRGVLGLTLLASATHMVVTMSRGGWLAVSLGVIVLVLLVKPTRRWASAAVLAITVLALLSPVAELVLDSIPLTQSESLRDRASEVAAQTWDRALSMLDGADFSITQRRIIWGDTINMARSNLFLGVGPGNYELFLPAYRTMPRHRAWRDLMGERGETAFYAHNEYLEVLAESGVPGLVALLWVVGVVLWLGWRAVAGADSSPTPRVIKASCMAAVAAALVHAFFSFNLQDPTSASHFWVLVGVLAVLSRLDNQRAGADNGSGEQTRMELDLHGWRRLATAGAAAAVLALGLNTGMGLLMGDYHYFQGRKYDRFAQPNRAALSWRRAIEWREHDFRYHHMLGKASLEAGRTRQAVSALLRSVELHPYNASALRLLGSGLQELGQLDKAVKALRRAVRLDPLRPSGYRQLALAYREKGSFANAIETWEQALALTPENAALLNSLGVDHARAGQVEEAAEALERAAHLDPSDQEIQANLGMVYVALGRFEEGESKLNRALASEPDRPAWHLYLAQHYANSKRLDAAWREARAALRLAPENPSAQQLVETLEQARKSSR